MNQCTNYIIKIFGFTQYFIENYKENLIWRILLKVGTQKHFEIRLAGLVSSSVRLVMLLETWVAAMSSRVT